MMKSPFESSSGDKLKQLEGHRRSFLGRLLARGVAIAAVPAIAAIARGEEDGLTVVTVKGRVPQQVAVAAAVEQVAHPPVAEARAAVGMGRDRLH
jgi:hypothetical protein